MTARTAGFAGIARAGCKPTARYKIALWGPVTDMLKPGDFPLGSINSRAAMRMQLANRQDTRRRIEIITNALFPWRGPDPAPGSWGKEPHGQWQYFGDVLMRILYVPPGMSVEEARQAVDQ